MIFHLHAAWQLLFGCVITLTAICMANGNSFYTMMILVGLVEMLIGAIYFLTCRSRFNFIDDNFDNKSINVAHRIISIAFCFSPEYVYI